MAFNPYLENDKAPDKFTSQMESEVETILVESVGTGDFRVVACPHVLATTLGSCVAVCLYDPIQKIGGMAHIMLPDSSLVKSSEFLKAKFADTAAGILLDKMTEVGAVKSRIVAKIIGGARMFSNNGYLNHSNDIGSRNVNATKEALKKGGVRILAADTGGNHGRSLKFYMKSGTVAVKMMVGNEQAEKNL